MFNRVLVSALLLLGIVGTTVFALPRSVAAAPALAPDTRCTKNSFLGLPAWYKYLDIGERKDKDGNTIDPCAIIGPLNTPGDPGSGLDWGKASGKIGLAIVDILLRIAGLVAVGFTIYGGIQYVLSEGDPEKAKKARESIFNALIGLVIVIVSTGAVTLVGNTIIK